jgi:AAA domain
VSSSERIVMLGTHRVEKGQVAYFVGENPDELRMRLIGADAVRGGDPTLDRLFFAPGVFNIGEMMAALAKDCATVGPLDLVIVDTSAAYFLGADEISNTEMGKQARILRALTALPGAPCVLVLCHPIKHVTEPAQLLPRGGGAFLAEMDGNLTVWKHNDGLVELHHNKIRGPGFEPMMFKLDKFITPKLVDAKGRPLPTVRAVHVSQADEDKQSDRARDDEDRVLARLLAFPNLSMAEIAIGLGRTFKSGEAAKSRVARAVDRLKGEKPVLILKKRDKWTLTEKGKEAARIAALRFLRQDANDPEPDVVDPNEK